MLELALGCGGVHVCLCAAASEVSSILESRIAGTAVGANVEETGRVLSKSCDVFRCFAEFVNRVSFPQALVTVLPASGVLRMSKVCIS